MRYFYVMAILLFAPTLFAQIDTVNFETPAPHINIDTNSGNIWQIGKPNKTVFDSAYSGSNAILTDTLLPYPINNTSSFTLCFELYGGQPSIKFKHRFDSDTLNDGGFVEISSDSGQTWLLLSDTTSLDWSNGGFYFAYGLETFNFYGVSDSLAGGKIGFSGRSNDWVSSTILFPCYAIKKPFELMLRFTFVSDSTNNPRDGWMIDDIIIQNQGGCSSIDENQLSQVEVYPNPLNTRGRIDLGENNYLQNGSYTLYTLSGEKAQNVKNLYGNSFEIERNQLPAGLYTLVVYEDGKPVSMAKVSFY